MISRLFNSVCLFALVFTVACGTGGSLRIGPNFKKSSVQAWKMVGGNDRRTHCSESSITAPLELVWEKTISSSPAAHLLISDDILYVSSLDGRFYAFQLADGDRIGYMRLPFASRNGMTIDHQTAYIALSWGTSTLYSYNLFEGKKKYDLDMKPVETNPLVVEDLIYLASLDGKFHALNKSDGSHVWTFDTPKPVRSSPAVEGSSVVFGCDDGYVYALNRFNGTLKWKFKTGEAIYATPTLDDNQVFVGSTDGVFYCLSLQDGTRLWSYTIGREVPGRFYASAGLSKTSVYVGGTDGTLYALAKSDGTLRWKFKAGGAISVAPLITDGLLLVASQEGVLYAVDPATGTSSWQFKTNSRIKTEIAVYGKYVAVGSERKHVYVFRSGSP